jgi:Fe-S-cluster containining protein
MVEESLCSKCAKGKLGSRSSCVTPFFGKQPGFWLTLSDVARIVKKTGQDPEKFCRFEEVEDDGDENKELDDRHVDLMSVGDKNILMNGNGTCFFLGKNGCEIHDARPKMCRIYPFWFKEGPNDVRITVQHEDLVEQDDCLITKINFGNYDIAHLLGFIDETEEGMKKCVKEYLKEMKTHNRFKAQLEKKPMLKVLKGNGLLK